MDETNALISSAGTFGHATLPPGCRKNSHHCMQDAHKTTNPSLLKTVLQLQKNTSRTTDTKECSAVRLSRTVWSTSGEASITERAGTSLLRHFGEAKTRDGSKAKTYEERRACTCDQWEKGKVARKGEFKTATSTQRGHSSRKGRNYTANESRQTQRQPHTLLFLKLISF